MCKNWRMSCEARRRSGGGRRREEERSETRLSQPSGTLCHHFQWVPTHSLRSKDDDGHDPAEGLVESGRWGGGEEGDDGEEKSEAGIPSEEKRAGGEAKVEGGLGYVAGVGVRVASRVGLGVLFAAAPSKETGVEDAAVDSPSLKYDGEDEEKSCDGSGRVGAGRGSGRRVS
jgi:hypothetical protein